MVNFRFEVEGEALVDRTLDRFAAAVRDLSTPFRAIADDFRAVETRLFDTEGASSGRAWAPLAPATVRRKAPGLPILVETGDLRASLTQPGGDHIEEIDPDSLTLGSGVRYGGFHQRGTGRMAQRRPIDLSDEDRRRWIKILQAHLAREARRLGLMPDQGGGV